MRPVGVPNMLAAQRLSNATASLRRQSEAARQELTTGRIPDLPTSLGPKTGEAFLLRGAIDALAVRKQGLSQARLFAVTAQRSLEFVGKDARSLASDAIAANGRGDETALAAVAVEARASLREAFSNLNVRIAGQSIFAGDASDRPALTSADQLLADISALYTSAPDASAFDASLDLYFTDPAGGFRSTIYSGGDGEAASIEIDRGERLIFAPRADDPSIRDLLRAFAAIAVAGAAPPSALRDGALASAASEALIASDALTARRAEIGVAEARVADALLTLEIEEVTLTEAYNAITARDPFEVAARLQSLESQLSAALTLTARISQLSLTNFLR
jgi:flagellar hook-associated protein 3 FlgL